MSSLEYKGPLFPGSYMDYLKYGDIKAPEVQRLIDHEKFMRTLVLCVALGKITAERAVEIIMESQSN